MTSGAMWQGDVGRAWADEADLTDRSFGPLTQALLARIGEGAPNAVLDIGCGAGELTLALARQHGDAQLCGLDISADLLAVARHRAEAAGLADRVRFQLGDAGADWPTVAPDTLVSRHGVMFFADPPAAFAHLRAVAAPAAGLAFTCFRAGRENGWAADVAALVGAAPSPDADPQTPPPPGPFAFADPAYVRELLSGAGWHDIALEPVDYAYVAGAGADPVAQAMAFFRRIGPAARALRETPAAERPAVEARITAWLQAHCRDGVVSFAAAAWIVTARAG